MCRPTLIYFFIAIFFLSTACETDNGEQEPGPSGDSELMGEDGNDPSLESELRQEVMAVHDSVMPRIDDITRLRNQMKSLKAGMLEDTVQYGHEMVEEVDRNISGLEHAYEGMMSWMANLKREGQVPPGEMEAYYAEEMIKIARVRDDMLESIANAKATLWKYEE